MSELPSSRKIPRHLHGALVPLDRLGNLDGNMHPLRDWPFKCSACESRDVALWLFPKRAEADAWANVETVSGPSF